MKKNTALYRVRAAFSFNGGATWKWHTWTAESDGNKHIAIIAKANELGANAWDYGNADFAELGSANF